MNQNDVEQAGPDKAILIKQTEIIHVKHIRTKLSRTKLNQIIVSDPNNTYLDQVDLDKTN